MDTWRERRIILLAHPSQKTLWKLGPMILQLIALKGGGRSQVEILMHRTAWAGYQALLSDGMLREGDHLLVITAERLSAPTDTLANIYAGNALLQSARALAQKGRLASVTGVLYGTPEVEGVVAWAREEIFVPEEGMDEGSALFQLLVRFVTLPSRAHAFSLHR